MDAMSFASCAFVLIRVCFYDLHSEFMSACQEAHRKTMIPLLEEFVSKGWVRVESHPVAFLEVCT